MTSKESNGFRKRRGKRTRRSWAGTGGEGLGEEYGGEGKLPKAIEKEDGKKLVEDASDGEGRMEERKGRKRGRGGRRGSSHSLSRRAKRRCRGRERGRRSQ